MNNEFYIGFGVKSTIIPGCSEDDYCLRGVAKFTAESQEKAETMPSESTGRIKARLETKYRNKLYEVVPLGEVYGSQEAAEKALPASASRHSLVAVEI